MIFIECLFGKAPYASRTFQELGEKIWDERPVEVLYYIFACNLFYSPSASHQGVLSFTHVHYMPHN